MKNRFLVKQKKVSRKNKVMMDSMTLNIAIIGGDMSYKKFRNEVRKSREYALNQAHVSCSI